MPSYSRKVQLPGKTSSELYEAVSQGIELFLSKTPLGKCEIQRDPDKKELRVKASMLSATLVCSEGQMELNAKMSMLAAPFKGKFDESITRWLAKTFNMPNGPSQT